MSKGERIGRVIDVLPLTEGVQRLVVLIGDAAHQLDVTGSVPALGDVFTITPGDPPALLKKIGASYRGGWPNNGDGMRWRIRNARGQTRLNALWQRHAIRRAVRDYLDSEGFIQVDVPLLVHGATPDTAIQSFAVDDRYLVASAEYQIKRLEVGGFDRIYTLTQNYRRVDGEGRFRNPEFTMLEWARVGQSLSTIEGDVEKILLCAHEALGGKGVVAVEGHEVDLAPPWDRLSVADAIERATGAHLSDFSLRSLKAAVAAAGIEIKSDSRVDVQFLFSLLMSHIQATLGLAKPLFVCDWPAFETSSAEFKPGGDLAERSELFIAGVEIADGFSSLTNYERQFQALALQNKRRVENGSPAIELDRAYLSAVQ